MFFSSAPLLLTRHDDFESGFIFSETAAWDGSYSPLPSGSGDGY